MHHEPVTLILLAEDDAGHARLIEKQLRRSNLRFEMRHFAEGQQLFDYFEDEILIRPNPQLTRYIILLDLNMPGVDGFQVLRHLKNHEQMHLIPISVFSSSTDADEIRRCYELGCAIYLTKSVEYQQFAATLLQLGNFLSTIHLPGVM